MYRRKRRKENPTQVTGDSHGGRAVCAYLRDSLGSIYSPLGGRRKVLRLIILLPPPFFLPVCSQAKVKCCPVSLCLTENLYHRQEAGKRGDARQRAAWWSGAA